MRDQPPTLQYATPPAARPEMHRQRRRVLTNPVIIFWRRHTVLIGVIWTFAIFALGWLTHSYFDADDDYDRIQPLLSIWSILILTWPFYIIAAWILCVGYARPRRRRAEAGRDAAG